MSMRPFTDNRGGLNHLVDAQIGRAFPVVHKVYQHLDAIEYVAQVYESGRARDIVIRTNHTKEWIEWQYKGEAKWTILFKFSDLLGADIADVVAAEQAIAAELKQLRQQLAADAKTVIEARAAATEARLGAEAARDAASESQAAAAQSVVTATQLAQNLGDATAAAEASAAAAQADREAAQAAQAVVTSSAQEASTAAVAANAARDSAQGSATEASAAKDVTSLLQAAAEQSALAAAQSQTAAGDFADAASASATAAALSESTAASHLADLTIAAATTEAAAAAGAQHLSAIESQVVAAGLLKEQAETASQAAVDAQAAAEVAANAAEAAVATVTAGVAEVAASTTTATEAATQASNARDTAVSSAVTATEQAATATASRAAAELAAATASAAQLSSGNFLTEVEQFRDLTQVLRNEAETFRDESLTYRNQAEQMQIDAQVVAADRQRAEDAADSIAAAKSKLDGIAPGATANQTDVFLLNRVNHTGEQPISTVAGLQDSLDSKQNTLISGISLKTINGESILGGGNLVVGGGGSSGPTLQGDTAPYTAQTKTYQITNYNSFSSYTVSASAGTASLGGDTITFTAPSSAGNVSLTLTVDGQPTAFVIAVQAAPPYIPTPTPTPANFADPLEGGFYAGMVWGQIAQSSTSMAIATGSKTFTVPDMTNAPIVYADQQLEVRSRANPANKFVGTVTGAAGTNLTINVTSIGGSGTFSDWSVMARHRVIVAPKASGEHAGIALKNANTALPTACQTLAEGFAATQAMRDADTSTVYPAAHWVRNLAIGGRTDWYIPARDELELCWRNLKPITATNYVDANRATAASFSYANNGSYGDTANMHGTNNNSSPTGAAYTASVPGQTAATAFRTGGAEAYESGSASYWSSSDYNASVAWHQYWHSFPGCQDSYGKTGTLRVRAVRRSII